ncbi:MAG: hypothetical protein J5789_09135 [Oscillospiraceae bacterium]|nr:hypothetical protein [Oscillospiraceae bacterium]
MTKRKSEGVAKWILLVLLALIVGIMTVQCFSNQWPLSMLQGFADRYSVQNLTQNGALYTICQILSPLSSTGVFLLAFFNLMSSFSFFTAFLLFPVMMLAGWILFHFRVGKQLGRVLMLIPSISTMFLFGVLFAYHAVMLLFVENRQMALLQMLYYLALMVVPLVELVLLHKWMNYR